MPQFATIEGIWGRSSRSPGRTGHPLNSPQDHRWQPESTDVLAKGEWEEKVNQIRVYSGSKYEVVSRSVQALSVQ